MEQQQTCHLLKNHQNSTPAAMAPTDAQPPLIGSDKFVIRGCEDGNSAPDTAQSQMIRPICGQAVNTVTVSQVPRCERSIYDGWLILWQCYDK